MWGKRDEDKSFHPPGGGRCVRAPMGTVASSPEKKDNRQQEPEPGGTMANASCAQAWWFVHVRSGPCIAHTVNHAVSQAGCTMAAVGSSGNIVRYPECRRASWVWTLGQKSPREQDFWKSLLPAVPGITGALPAECAVSLHLEPAATWDCEEAKMWKVIKEKNKVYFLNLRNIWFHVRPDLKDQDNS